MAARLAEVPGLHVHVSLDGATPRRPRRLARRAGKLAPARGEAIHMLENGIAVHGVHVVTPENEHELDDYLEQMWVLGLPVLRVTPVVPVGAAARGGEWVREPPADEAHDRGVPRARRPRT